MICLCCCGFFSKAQKLKFLIPDGAVVQHAGSIGYFSGGVSYDLFKSKKGSLDITYGYLPENKGGAFSTISTKFIYRPLKIKANDWLTIYPINPATFISYTVNKDFDLTWDRGQYSKGYYYWSEALRIHLAFGSELKFNTNKLIQSKKINALSLYYEINTNDVYIINYVQNKSYLNITDIFKAGIGLRAYF
ncbi:hypothetical protein A5893_09675 [Pedobacter psychrophilus]|uniref:Outer membrane protein beta-barrel domain-containing protein n=1 Tax=Pedobacter psychrophilus TaxID=1826909 RepID=A0A179DFW4_9SPHI|nr:hypothetical protein A5893_09675 [Pedobacter psychrophilus]